MYIFMSRLPQKDHEQRGEIRLMYNHMNLPSPQLHRNIRTMKIEQGNKGIEQKEENKLLYAYLYERFPYLRLLKIMLIQFTWRLWRKEQSQRRDSNQLMHIYMSPPPLHNNKGTNAKEE